MRTTLRALAVVAAGVGLATCSDLPSAPLRRAKGVGRLAFAPVFSRAATQTFDRLPDFGIDFDNVRVVIARSTTDTVKDTTVAFGRGQADLAIDLSVQVRTDHETFDADIDYRNKDEVLFHGEGKVQAHAANEPPPSPPQITVNYKGPGANAKRIQVSPQTSSISVADSVKFSAAAFDDTDQPMAGVPVAWISSDTTLGTIDLSGVLHPTGKRGTVTVTATTPTGLTDHASVSLIPLPKALAVISGAGETGVAGQAMSKPVVIEVRDSDSLPVPGVAVSFTAPAGASVAPASAVADSNGRASAALTLAPTAGPQVFTASAGDLSVQVPETAKPGAFAKIAFKAQPSNVPAGVPIAPAVQVELLDANGNQTTDNTNVALTVHGGASGALLSGTAIQAAVSGLATFSDLSVDKQGTGYTLEASVGSTVPSVTSRAFDVSNGHATKLAFVTQPSDTSTASVISPAVIVQVRDPYGNVVPSDTTPVTLQIVPGTGTHGATLGGTSTQISKNGNATFADLKIAQAGTGYRVVAASGKLTSDTSTSFNIHSVLPSLTIVTAPDTLPHNSATLSTQPVLSLVDGSGQPLSGIVISASAVRTQPSLARIGPGPAFDVAPTLDALPTLSNTTATTDDKGLATFTGLKARGKIQAFGVQFSATVNGVTVTVTSPGVLHLRAGDPSRFDDSADTIVVDTIGARFGASHAHAPRRVLLDDSGNPVFGEKVTFNATSGACKLRGNAASVDVVTDSSGVAALDSLALPASAAGSCHLEARDPNFPGAGSARYVAIGTPKNTTHVWVGRADTAWSNPANWYDTVAANDRSHNVFVPSSVGRQPKLTGAVTTGDLVLERGASVDIRGTSGGLTAFGDVDAKGGSISNGALSLRGTGKTARGALPSVVVGQSGCSASTAAYTLSDSTTVTGDLVTNCPLDAGAHTLEVSGSVDASAGAITNGTLTLHGSSATVRGAVPALVIGSSNCTDGAAATLGSDVTVTGDLTANCSLDVHGKSLRVNGMFATAGSSGALRMSDSTAKVTVNGDASFGGASTSGNLTAGELVVSGNFTQNGDRSSFAASGNHKVTLASSGAQTVSFANPDPSASHFAHLEVKGSTSASPSISRLGPSFNRTPGTALFGTSSGMSGVVFSNDIVADSIVVDSTTAAFQGDASIDGDLVAHKGSLTSGTSTSVTVGGAVIGDAASDFSGISQLVVSGSKFPSLADTLDGTAPASTVLTGSVSLATNIAWGGALTVEGSLNVNGKTLSITRDLAVSGASGKLQFPSSASTNYVKVGGNARFAGAATDSTGLHSGTLEVAGNFMQSDSVSAASFAPADTFIVKLSGTNSTTPQAISFADTTHSYFAHVQLRNSAAGAQLGSNVAAHNDVDVYGLLSIPSSTLLSIKSGKQLKLHMNSHVTLDGDVAVGSSKCQKNTTGVTIDGANRSKLTNGSKQCADTTLP